MAGEAEQQALLKVLQGGWIAPVGPELNAFENALSGWAGGQSVAALSSGTAALHLALQLVGVKPGDAVVVSDWTFIAPVNAVRYLGAEPILVDAEPHSWNMSPDYLAEALLALEREGRRVAAAIVIDLYGQCADFAKLKPLLAARGIPLVEDAAEALGASRQGRPAGSFGEVAAFSFNGNKIITTSNGGALTAADSSLVQRARYLASQARQPAVHYEHTEVGYNYRLSNLLAAFGLAQLDRLQDNLKRRREIADRYAQALAPQGWLAMPVPEDSQPNYWLPAFLLPEAWPAGAVNRVVEYLRAARIEVRPLWKPMHLQPVFADARYFGNNLAGEAFARGLCLPSGLKLTDAEQAQIIRLLTDFDPHA